MHFYTYKITNLINGKIYVGVHKTTNLEDGYMGSGVVLKRSISKHGIENFKKEILMFHDNETDMFELEELIVDRAFVDRSDTYNIKLGGQGGFDHLNRDHAEMVRRMKLAMSVVKKNRAEIPGYADALRKRQSLETSNRWKNPKYATKVSNSIKMSIAKNGHVWLGRNHSEESKAKLKESFAKIEHQQGTKNSMYGKMWIHSLEERKSTCINNNEPIPTGWMKGRKMFKVLIGE